MTVQLESSSHIGHGGAEGIRVFELGKRCDAGQTSALRDYRVANDYVIKEQVNVNSSTNARDGTWTEPRL